MIVETKETIVNANEKMGLHPYIFWVTVSEEHKTKVQTEELLWSML